jgi:hypothetical protein
MTIMGLGQHSGAATQSGTDPPFDSIPPPQISYIDPDGNTWPLSDLTMQNGYICTGITGISGIPVSFSSIPLLNGGALPQLYTPQPGAIGLGLFFESQGDINAYMALLDSFAYAFYNVRNNVPTPGQLVVQRQDGTARYRNVFCVGGQDIAVDEGVDWSEYTLSLQADDPFWYDLAPNVATYELAATTSSGILPLLPINLAISTVFGADIIDNEGGAEAYPEWLITGPGLPTIQNQTTGKQFSLTSALSDLQQIQINTQPGNQSAVDVGAGVSVWADVVQSTPRDLWALARGLNEIFLTMGGAGADSAIRLTWTRRWLRA